MAAVKAEKLNGLADSSSFVTGFALNAKLELTGQFANPRVDWPLPALLAALERNLLDV